MRALVEAAAELEDVFETIAAEAGDVLRGALEGDGGTCVTRQRYMQAHEVFLGHVRPEAKYAPAGRVPLADGANEWPSLHSFSFRDASGADLRYFANEETFEWPGRSLEKLICS
ncbi:MAG: hypothetical protein R3C27_15735 [Hyphomonadaceae bacterium]